MFEEARGEMEITLRFRPISTIPDDVCEAVLLGGEMDSAAKLRPYDGPLNAWRHKGRWFVGRGCEVEIASPTHWAAVPPELRGGPPNNWYGDAKKGWPLMLTENHFVNIKTV